MFNRFVIEGFGTTVFLTSCAAFVLGGLCMLLTYGKDGWQLAAFGVIATAAITLAALFLARRAALARNPECSGPLCRR